MRWTEEQYQSYLQQGDTAKVVCPVPQSRYRSKTEGLYANMLTLAFKAREIDFWAYEALKLRLGDNCFYTPDFMVIRTIDSDIDATGQIQPAHQIIELHEIKGGFIRDKGLVKFKAAQRMYPMFDFQLHQYKKGAWGRLV